MRHLLLLLLWSLVASTADCPQHPHRTPWEWTEPIRQAFNSVEALLRQKDYGNGLSASAVYGGQKIWDFNSGTRDKIHPTTSDTIYRVGSISKTFAAALLWKAIEAKKVKKGDSIRDTVPLFHPADPFKSGIDITWAQLGSHMSGLPNYGPCQISSCITTTTEMLAKTAQYDLIVRPGSQALYSNFGFAFVGHLAAEYLFNNKYETLCAATFLDPLGLTNTGFNFTDKVKNQMAQGYNSKGAVPKGIPELYWYRPSGQMYSTVNDLAKWMIKWLATNPKSDPLFNLATLEDAFNTIYWTDSDHKTFQAFPWEMGKVDSYLVHKKYGSIDGFSAILSMIFPLDFGVTILWNTEFVPSQDIILEVLNILVPVISASQIQKSPIPPGPVDYAKYVGTYTSPGQEEKGGADLFFNITESTYAGQKALLLQFPAIDKFTRYLVLPSDGTPNVLRIWIPPSAGGCEAVREMGSNYERFYFEVAEGKVVAVQMPGVTGAGYRWVKRALSDSTAGETPSA